MTKTERNFLRGICQCPRDDHLKLVYADWLEDQGRLEESGVIRDERIFYLQASYLGSETFASFDEGGNDPPPLIATRLGALHRDNPWIYRLSMRRGFLFAVTLQWKSWADNWEYFISTHPIQKVSVVDLIPYNFTMEKTHSIVTLRVPSSTREELTSRVYLEYGNREKQQEIASGFFNDSRPITDKLLKQLWPDISFSHVNHIPL